LSPPSSAAHVVPELLASHQRAMEGFGRSITPMIHAMVEGLGAAFAEASRSMGALHAELVRSGLDEPVHVGHPPAWPYDKF
jgi:predicted Zn-dependent protease